MITITASDFKTFFDRGQFSYGADIPDIRDKDIAAAITEAEAVFNHNLYPDETIEEQALLYLTAHFLQLDYDASNSGGGSAFVQNSRSADGISESLSIPEELTTGDFAFYGTTYYGQKWYQLSKPYLTGAIFSVKGRTQF